MKKECVAMLLAGGQGSRLYVLTGNMAKPAVPFGGKFRIIDFPLSNCTNSGIDTVGVLTQYRPLELNSYIGNGQPWELDRINGGVHILPPYQCALAARYLVQGHGQRHLSEHRLRGYVRPGVCAGALRRPYLQDGLLRYAPTATRRPRLTAPSPSWKSPGRRPAASAS